MSPDQAFGMRDAFVEQVERESKTTRRVIAAVPTDKSEYRPDPKCMSALELSWHLASADVWFLNSVAAGEFSPGGQMPADIKDSAGVLAWYEPAFAEAIEKVKAMDADACAKIVSFHDVFHMPAVLYLNFNLLHCVHHRGQLSVYLRPMGAKVPSIYGGSADEPFEMPAKASS